MILKDLGVAIPVNTSNYLLFIYLYLTEQKHLLRIRRNLISRSSQERTIDLARRISRETRVFACLLQIIYMLLIISTFLPLKWRLKTDDTIQYNDSLL